MRAPTKGRKREIQVGLFLIMGFLVIIAYSFKITDTPIFQSGKDFVIYLDDASGIFINSKVKMAGIDVGSVNKIELEGLEAKITLRINDEVEIPSSAVVVPRPLGILGDKYLEIQVDREKEKEKETLPDKQSFRGLPKALSYFIDPAYAQNADTAKSKKGGVEVLKSKNSSGSLEGLSKDANIITSDLRTVSKDMKDIVSGNKEDIDATIKRLNRITKKVDRLLDEVNSAEMKEELRELNKSIVRLSSTIKNVEKLSGKIADGEGSVGKLINDSETVDQLNQVLYSLNSTLNKVNQTQIVADLRSEYNFEAQDSKTYVGLGLYPREDIGYEAAIVIDSDGSTKRKITVESVNGGAETTTVTDETNVDSVRFSFQLTKKIWNWGFRLGLFENKGGVASDVYMFHDKLKLSTEIYDFSRDSDNAFLKVTANWRFLSYFNLYAGGDDLISRSNNNRKGFFLGLGLRFNDEDLRSLLLLSGAF